MLVNNDSSILKHVDEYKGISVAQADLLLKTCILWYKQDTTQASFKLTEIVSIYTKAVDNVTVE